MQAGSCFTTMEHLLRRAVWMLCPKEYHVDSQRLIDPHDLTIEDELCEPGNISEIHKGYQLCAPDSKSTESCIDSQIYHMILVDSWLCRSI